MFNRNIVTKNYKFVYVHNRVKNDYTDASMMREVYTFGNRCSDMFVTKYRCEEFFQDIVGHKFYNDLPAFTEATITKLMCKHFDNCVKERTKVLKDTQIEANEYVWKGPGFVNATEHYKHVILRVSNQIKAYKHQRKLWKQRYNYLASQGVYTFAELMK